MRKFILLAVVGFGLTATPVIACDLDGMFGPHRFNAFASLGDQAMFEMDPQPLTPPQTPEPRRTDNSESPDSGSKPTTFATLTEQLDREPTDPPTAENMEPGQAPREDNSAPPPSAMFR